MKTHFTIIIIVLVGIVSFMIGYSVAPTDVSTVRHSVPQQAASGGGDSGGYGGDSGGYGAADSGGYGAPAAGGYGAPAAGGYGAPAAGGYGAPAAGGYGM